MQRIRPIALYLTAPILAYAMLGAAVAVGHATPCGTDPSDREIEAFFTLIVVACLSGVAGLCVSFSAFARRSDWLVVGAVAGVLASLVFPLPIPDLLIHQLSMPLLLVFLGLVVFRLAVAWRSGAFSLAAASGVVTSLAFFPVGAFAFAVTVFRCGLWA